jgi:hypothetical protein
LELEGKKKETQVMFISFKNKAKYGSTFFFILAIVLALIFLCVDASAEKKEGTIRTPVAGKTLAARTSAPAKSTLNKPQYETPLRHETRWMVLQSKQTKVEYKVSRKHRVDRWMLCKEKGKE